ncbi:MAG: methyltransferase domain-containing protein [Candidatus Micrarchaeota archaeon]|nr:methyltransferase domain-containing protein [Candidatus Micrarchaeota archaeon]
MGYHAYDPKIYQKKVERIDDPIFQNYQKEEIRYIRRNIENPKQKTVIEIGAGYGRGVKRLARIGKEVIGVELGDRMYDALKENVRNLNNVTVIHGDAAKLSSLVGNVESPAIVLLQNTVGIFGKDLNKILLEMKKVAEEGRGEIIISAFNSCSLRAWGVPIIYKKAQDVVGENDPEKTDYERGIFATKSGYVSKWWTPDEMRGMAELLGGKRRELCVNNYYQILHVSYSS